MDYVFRPSTDEDKPWLDTLRRTVYKDLFDATWGGWDEARHQRHFGACWEEGGIQIIEISGTPIGMLKIFDQDHTIEIGEIQIMPSHQGQGLGTKILTSLIQKAQSTGKDLILSTGLKNLRAVNLYKRLGFQETKRTDTHVHYIWALT